MRLIVTMTLFILILPSASFASLVTPQQSVVFSFDTSSLGDVNFTSFNYQTTACSQGSADQDCQLGVGNSFDLDFGTSFGSNDLGTSTFTNPFDFSITNVGAGLIPNQFVPASVATLFVSLVYNDDVFDAEVLNLNSPGVSLSGQFAGVNAVPIPAAVWLFGTALVGFVGLSRRRKIG